MKLAILMNLAPRKLGSFEAWIVAMCEQARARGHAVDVYGRAPVHPVFAERLKGLGCGYFQVAELERSAYEGIRRLKRYDAIHLNMFVPRSRIALMASAAYPAKVMFVDHTSGPVPGERKHDGTLVGLLKRAADVASMLRVEGIAGVSEYVSERNRRRFGPNAKKVRTIYNGVDLQRFVPKDTFFDLAPQEAARPTGPLSVLAVAHLIPQKGVDYLIRAVALAEKAELRLKVVGDGPELERLKALAEQLSLSDRVEFAGLRDDVNALLAQSDVFVHPAVWEEAFGLTIAEAMANGCAVIATRIGGIPELVEHERSGLLVSPKSAEELAAALELLWERPELRRQLGENARARAEQRFNLQQCALEHVRWCEGATASAPQPQRPSRDAEQGSAAQPPPR